MANTVVQLEFVGTEDLVDELMRRVDVGMMAYLPKTGGKQIYCFRYSGSPMEILGLDRVLRRDVRERIESRVTRPRPPEDET